MIVDQSHFGFHKSSVVNQSIEISRTLLLLSTALFCLAGCGCKLILTPAARPPEPHEFKAPPSRPQQIEIKCEAIGKRLMGTNMHITGRILPEADKETEISARFGGRVLEVKVNPGDKVRAGQVLCIINSHEIGSLQAELIEARSKLRIAEAHEEREKQILQQNLQHPKSLNEATTHHEESKVHLQLAESEYKRLEGLHREKIASEKDFLSAQATYAKAKLSEKEALTELQREKNLYENGALLKRDLQLAEAERLRDQQHFNTLRQRLELAGLSEKAIDDILKTGKITAIVPVKTRVAGTVTFLETAKGESVPPEKHIFTVTDLSKVAVIADLPESDLDAIKAGSPVKVKVASYPDRTFTAVIGYISDTINPESKTVAVRAILDNADRKFKLNMSADIYLSAPPRPVLVCPKSAVHSFGKSTVVFVRDGNQFRERKVKTGADDQGYYEVISGLAEGEEVAAGGSMALKSEHLQEH